jgi:GTP-binding protein
MKKVQFVKSVYDLNDLPKLLLPEIVLCGRSNVGKSSFINSLFNQKRLAKISSSPGKTRALNYYLVEEKFYIVDLPGFGYDKVSKKEREKWQKLIEKYLTADRPVSLAFHFIDRRHKPTHLDQLLNQFLIEREIPYTIILTKVDKIKQSEHAAIKKKVKEFFPELIDGENLMSYSSVKGTGKKEVIKRLNALFN